MLTPKRALWLALAMLGFSVSSSFLIRWADASNPIVILPAHHASAALTVEDSSRLNFKFSSDPTVYYVSVEGCRQAYPSMDVFLSLNNADAQYDISRADSYQQVPDCAEGIVSLPGLESNGSAAGLYSVSSFIT